MAETGGIFTTLYLQKNHCIVLFFLKSNHCVVSRGALNWKISNLSKKKSKVVQSSLLKRCTSAAARRVARFFLPSGEAALRFFSPGLAPTFPAFLYPPARSVFASS
jgi:hypothetical protein